MQDRFITNERVKGLSYHLTEQSRLSKLEGRGMGRIYPQITFSMATKSVFHGANKIDLILIGAVA